MMKFTLHYDDENPGPPRGGWWRYLILGIVLIVVLVLAIVARAM